MTFQSEGTTLTREELYDRVWAKPIITVAKGFGITGTGLAKICQRMSIPVPPRGYWAKLRFGKEVAKIPLPPPLPDTPLKINIRPTPPKAPTENAQSNPLQIPPSQGGGTSGPKLTVPQTLANPHPLVRKWIEEDRRYDAERRHSAFGGRPESNEEKAIKNRRLRILSVLFKEWEKLGHQIKTERQTDRLAYFEFRNQKIEFGLFEYERQFRRPLTDKEKSDWLYQNSKWRQVREPTGQLQFRIKTYIGPGPKLEWRDQDNFLLEDRLREILNGLISAGERLEELEKRRREKERQYWEEEQKRAAAERRRRIDRARWRHLIRLTKIAEEVREARAFLNEIENHLKTENPGGQLSDDHKTWLEWARAKADEHDPFLQSASALIAENQTIKESINELD